MDGRDARAANPGQAETLSLDTDMTSASRAKHSCRLLFRPYEDWHTQQVYHTLPT